MPTSPDTSGFDREATSLPRPIESVRKLSPFNFRGKKVELKIGRLGKSNSPVEQRTNTIISAYNSQNPNEVYGHIFGELKEKSLHLTWAQRLRPNRGIVGKILQVLIEQGELSRIDTKGEQLSDASIKMAESLERESRESDARFSIALDRDSENNVTGFTMIPKEK